MAIVAVTVTAGSTYAAPRSPAVLLAAGDVADCNSGGDEATARILATQSGAVATLGDNAYETGSASDYEKCYAPSWGRFKSRTHPAPGNHEYVTRDASGYFDYFGPSAGPRGKGWYSYELGAWHVIVLNSNCYAIGGCDAGSPQGRWLRADLAAHPRACTLAYWHHARFSSGLHGSNALLKPFWQLLYAAGADVVMSGHDHDYERFAPQTPAGRLDKRRGIVEFVVGTGGKSYYALKRRIANSVVRHTGTFGVLRLTLRARGYSWKFLPVAGARFTDAGSGRCH